jgi:hypothetical protein
LNNDGAGLLFRQEQKDQPECSSYFMHVPKREQIIKTSHCPTVGILAKKSQQQYL